MAEEQPKSIADISPEEWAATPESVKRLVTHLVGQVEQLGSLVNRVETLERQQEELKAENQLLKEQVQQNSQNSSHPPSRDQAKGFKRKAKPASGKKPGAQSGHEGHERLLYGVEQCQVVEDHYPNACIHCGTPLVGRVDSLARVSKLTVKSV